MKIIGLLLLTIIIPSLIKTESYCVDRTNGNDNNNGLTSSTKCFKTSSKAISEATTEGDIICYYPGRYGGFTISVNSLTIKPCENVNPKDVTFYRRDIEDLKKAQGVIIISKFVTDTHLKNIWLDPDLLGSGKNGIYSWGKNDRTHIEGGGFDGVYHTTYDLYYMKLNDARDGGPDLNQRVIRVAGDEMIIEKTFARYWPHIIAGPSSDDSHRNLIINNTWTNAGHTIFSLESDCYGESDYLEGSVYAYNIFGRSYVSDGSQMNMDNNNPNPESPKDGIPLPCRGGDRFVNNIMYGFGEEAFDWKSGREKVMEGNLFVASTGDDDGPREGYANSCGGVVIAGGNTWSSNHLIRNNVFHDNCGATHGLHGDTVFYSNTVGNNLRSGIGHDDPSISYTAIMNHWGSFRVVANNVVMNKYGLLRIEKTNGRPILIDGNVYPPEKSTSFWIWDSSAEIDTFDDWKSSLAGHNGMEGADDNSVIGKTCDDVFKKSGMCEFRYPFDDDNWDDPHIDVTADVVLESLDYYKLKAEYESGGVALLTVQESGTDITIDTLDVGTKWTLFCCTAQQPDGWYNDQIEVNGQTVRIQTVDSANEQIILETTVTVSQGDPIVIISQTGSRSDQRGAVGYAGKTSDYYNGGKKTYDDTVNWDLIIGLSVGLPITVILLTCIIIFTFGGCFWLNKNKKDKFVKLNSTVELPISVVESKMEEEVTSNSET